MKKFILSIVLSIISYNLAVAVVADPNIKQVKQSDGTFLSIKLKGDERVSWAKTLDGYTLMHNSNSDFVYAISDGKNGMIPSDVIAHNSEFRSERERNFISQLDTNLFYSAEQISLLKQYFEASKDFISRVNKKSVYDSNVSENYKMLVILMSYNDYAFTTPKEEIDALFNQVGYSKNGHPGSVHDYFEASSYGQLNLSATVVGPYVADSSIQYYGQSGTVTYGNTSYEVNDLNAKELIREAVLKADPDVDFSLFTNGDGVYVSCVYVLYAGYAQSSGNASYTIWPHRSVVYPPIEVDGVQVYDYGCSSEKDGYEYSSGNKDLKIGTICHEFSHVLGQPDYYDTDYSENGSAFDPGSWDVMASGSYNGDSKFPVLWSAMERKERNYINIEELGNNRDYTLEDLQFGNKAYRMSFSYTTAEYFLIENRQQVGFDSYLPGHGLLIYHVDQTVSGWNSNCANCVASDAGYVLVPANNNTSGYYNQGQPFPGSTNNSSFTDSTTPSSLSKDNIALSKPLYRIKENTSTGNITFHVGDTTSWVNITPFTVSFSNDTANLSATIVSQNSSITERGFVVSSTKILPTTSDTKYIVSGSSSTFTKALVLNSNQTYYIRPYVIAGNTSYGESIKIKTPCPAITMFPYNDGFEDGISDCYSREYTKYIANDWQSIDTCTTAGAIQGANSGNRYAYIHSEGTDVQTIKLIMPPMDLSTLSNPILKFYHHQKTTNNRTDILKIYYKTSLNGSWNEIASFSNNINAWQKDSVLLPNASKTYFIAFASSVKGGLGIGLDDIEITDNNIASFPQIELDSIYQITDQQAVANATILLSGNSSITERGFVYSQSPNPTLEDSVLIHNASTTGAYNMSLTSLESATTYYVRAYAKNNSLLVYSNQISFTTKCTRINNYPYTLNVNSSDTLCLEMQNGWKTDLNDSSLYFTSQQTNISSLLILPIFDLSYQDSIKLLFDYKQTSPTNNLKVLYLSDVSSSWQELASISQETTSYSPQTINIPTLNHQNPTSFIAFEATSSQGGQVNIKNITLSTTKQIPTLTTDTAFLTAYNSIRVQGEILSEGLAPISRRGVVYSLSPFATIEDNVVNNPDTTNIINCLLTNLDSITTYYIRSFATNSYGTAYGEQIIITTPFTPIFNNVISADQHWCAGSVPSRLEGSEPTGGNGEYTYLWISSNDSITWDTCNESSAVTYMYYEPRQLFATKYYKRIVTSYLSVDTSNMVTISIDAATRGGNVFRQQDTAFTGSGLRMQLRAHVGSVLYWERLAPNYDWVQIPNSADSVYLTDTVYEPGTYYYRAVVQNGMCSSATSGQESIYVKEVVSLNEVKDTQSIIITPNPSDGKFFINYDGVASKCLLTISELNGKVLMKEDIILHEGNNLVDVSSLSSGSYVLTLKAKNINQTAKIVIIK